MINTNFFIIFTCLSLNLALQFALGVQDSANGEQVKKRVSFYRAFVLFFSVILTQLVFTYGIIPLGLASLETLFLLPLSILFAWLSEKGIVLLFAKWIEGARESVFSAYNGLVFGAAFFTLKNAESLADTFILAGGFSLGYILSMLIVLEIYKRSSIESVPSFLRGTPLFLISLGLMSLICSAAAGFFYQMILF